MTHDHEHHDHERDHDHDHEHEHHHDHDDPFHVHADAPLNVDELDPANRSLAEALRISFGLLKTVVLVLVVGFLLVGSYRKIEEGQVGLRTRFGAIQGKWVGEGETRHFVPDVLNPGAHFAWPEPIETVVIVPTMTKTVVIDRDSWMDMRGNIHEDTGFWFQPNPRDAGKALTEQTPQPGGLQPGRDGSLITADKNIVHGQWKANYRIKPTDAPRFVLALGAGDIQQSLRNAASAVRLACEQAIVQVVAQLPADVIVQGNSDVEQIRKLAQKSLDAMNCGITIDGVQLVSSTPPLSVLPAFNEVNQAQTARQQAINEARRDAEKALTVAAGRAYIALVPLLDYYEQARRENDKPRIARGWKAINALFSRQSVAVALADLQGDDHFDQQTLDQLRTAAGDVVIGGTVDDRIRSAESDKTNIRSAVQAQANAFLSYYNRYAARQPDGSVKIDHTLRRIIIERLWQDTMQAIFSGKDIETIILPPNDDDQLYLEIGRNPQLRRLREEAKLKQNIESQKNASQSP
ncbi:MAG: SPFH domain-containing protein [Phycisphaeraceae bacterium]